MGIISPFRPAASSGTDSQGSGETLDRSVASPEPHPFRASHGAATGATSEQRGSTQWVPPAQSDGGGVPAPLSPEAVQATIWPRDNPVADYLADEFCALLESNVYVPMTPNRRATVLAAMQSWVANLRMAYDVDWAENADDETRADSLWIESLVDEAVAR